MNSKLFRDRWVFPVSRPPINGAVVRIKNGLIQEVSKAQQKTEGKDLGNCAILPGLVNVHTHLEFSQLAEPLAEPGTPLPTWIRRVIEYRSQQAQGQLSDQQTAINRINSGLIESQKYGTALVGEIATRQWPAGPFESAPISSTVFLELMGLFDDQVRDAEQMSRVHLQLASRPSTRWKAGLSPHAPYTASLQLVEQTAKLSAETDTPVAMHLAESREELPLLSQGDGALRDLLEERGCWVEGSIPKKTSIREYLERLSLCARAMVIHGNYLNSGDIEFLARRSSRMSVIYCPRTHAFFGHDRYPLQELFNAGVCVGLGTDSRASNPDLSLWREVHSVARFHSGVNPETILKMANLGGATALGRSTEFGTLEPGKRAVFTVIRLPDRAGRDPYDLLMSDEAHVESTDG